MKTKFDFSVCVKAVAKFKRDDIIMAFCEMKMFHGDLVEAALPHLKDEANINIIWDQQKHDNKVRKMVIACLPLAGKNEDQLAEVIKKDRDHEDALLACLPYLDFKNKSHEEIVAWLEKTDWNEFACRKFFPPEKLKKMAESEIFDLLSKNKDSESLVEIFAPFIKSEDLIIRFIKFSRTARDYWVKPLNKLFETKKTDDEVLSVLQKINSLTAATIALKFLTQRKNILQLMDKYPYDEFTKLGLTRLNEIKQKDVTKTEAKP